VTSPPATVDKTPRSSPCAEMPTPESPERHGGPRIEQTNIQMPPRKLRAKRAAERAVA
jgi:hypothetical protein